MSKSELTFIKEHENLKGIPGIFASSLQVSQLITSDAPFHHALNPSLDFGGYAHSTKEEIDDSIWSHREINGQEILFSRASIFDSNESIQPEAAAESFTEKIGVDLVRAMEVLIEQATGRPRATFEEAHIPGAGTEAYACYCPYHYYHDHNQIRWGIYLFLEPLLRLTSEIHQASGNTLNTGQAFLLAWWSAYRHELFHHHVERFATKQEVSQRQPVFLRYKRNVFAHPSIRDTEDWLEEALAQNVVLDSKIVQKKVNLNRGAYKAILVDLFKKFPPGYKDFECTNHGGPANAHRKLAAQIITGLQHPGFRTTDLVTPKAEYSSRKELVPAYFAVRPNFVSQFQLSCPRRKKCERFARANGITIDKKSVGDHETWRLDNRKMHFNYKNGEADWASMKALAKMLDIPIREAIMAANRL